MPMKRFRGIGREPELHCNSKFPVAGRSGGYVFGPELFGSIRFLPAWEGLAPPAECVPFERGDRDLALGAVGDRFEDCGHGAICAALVEGGPPFAVSAPDGDANRVRPLTLAGGRGGGWVSSRVIGNGGGVHGADCTTGSRNVRAMGERSVG